jgi:hypothetical protein
MGKIREKHIICQSWGQVLKEMGGFISIAGTCWMNGKKKILPWHNGPCLQLTA